MTNYPNDFAFEHGPRRGEEIGLGVRKLCGKGKNLSINVRKEDIEGWGLKEGEMIEVKIIRTGTIKEKQNRPGNPRLKKTIKQS